MKRRVLVLSIFLIFVAPVGKAQNIGIPHLEKRDGAVQLFVDGQPFLMLAGELLNSSSSSLDYMRAVWPRLAAIPLNTVLTPLSWELVEPREGQFDFSLVDGLLEGARQNHLHLVFLWLASWKNGMSSYVPLWVKQDTRRFPRVIEKDGQPVEILSTFGDQSMQADARAFAALMRHIRQVDEHAHTVLMMQVENEVGVLGDSRDRSAAANQAFAGPVPQELMNYLQQHRDTLLPEFRQVWESAGAKPSGTWQEVFGSTPRTDQIFMAWNYARYIQHVTAAGKGEYPIPMYVNTWLARPEATPGEFPSGGPLPEVMDVWKSAGTAIDIYSPDIYAPNFAEWCDRYHRGGNPLFVPEAQGGSRGEANAFYTVGEHSALGFSPFGVDSFVDKERAQLLDPDNDLGSAYSVLMDIAPMILQHSGRDQMRGFVLDKDHPEVSFELNGYQLDVKLDGLFGTQTPAGFGLILALAPNEFLGAGRGFRVDFHRRGASSAQVGIGTIDEGKYSAGAWLSGRRLNGDEDDQGKYWRFAPPRINVEKCVLYRFDQ